MTKYKSISPLQIENQISLPCIVKLVVFETFVGINLSFSLTNNSSPTDTSFAYLRRHIIIQLDILNNECTT